MATVTQHATAKPVARSDTRPNVRITGVAVLGLLACHALVAACGGYRTSDGREVLSYSGWLEDAAVQRGYVQPGDFAQFGCPPGWMAVEETAAALRGGKVATTYIGTDPPPYDGTITCVAQKPFALRAAPASAAPRREPVRRPLAPVWVSTDGDGITIGFRREVPPGAAIYVARETPCGPRVIGVRLGDLLKWMADPSWGPKRDFLGMTSGGCPEQSAP